MPDLPTAQIQALKSWADTAINTGWMDSASVDELSSTITSAPAQLFEQPNRPLVAGYFHLISGHVGQKKLYKLVRSKFFFRDMEEKCATFCQALLLLSASFVVSASPVLKKKENSVNYTQTHLTASLECI